MNNNNERPRRNNRQGGRRRKVCSFCVTDHKNPEFKPAVIDYKNSDLLRKYVSDRGKISPRRITGTCAKHQRELTISIKRARHMALLPFSRD
ncbi:MAG: ribosomal protein [Haloplasmataceae bacterium]|jgi:small subunit ribosomal protein S18|nr:ribosomal protein [Haloplasmataceae bacterium]